MPRKPKNATTPNKTPQKQLEAMNAYRKRAGGVANIQRGFTTTYSRQEGDRIAAALTAAQLTPAQILRAVAVWIEQGTHPAAVASIPEVAAAYAAENAAIRAQERRQTTAPTPQPAEHPADSPKE